MALTRSKDCGRGRDMGAGDMELGLRTNREQDLDKD